MKKKKVSTVFVESDIAAIIDQYLKNLESGEGIKFKCLHSTPNTVVCKIGSQSFIISISDKKNLS